MSDNKLMFEAMVKSGGRTRFALSHIRGEDMQGRFFINGTDNISTNRTEIDPSTITPLFTTDKPDAWLFENADKRTLSNLNDDEASMVMMGWVQSGSGRFGTTQIFNGEGWEDLPNPEYLRAGYVCRVKAPGYSIDDAKKEMADARNGEESLHLINACSILDKFAKANGLGGKDE